MERRIGRIAGMLSLLFALGGCSAGIALTQYAEQTDHRPVQAGSTRQAVERELGRPVAEETHDDGSAVVVYREKVTNFSVFWSDAPSMRALFYVIADVGTLGLAELLTTPMEIGGKIYRAVSATEYRIEVVYDVNGRVVDFARHAHTP